MRTEVKTIKVDGETIHLFWDNASALDFARVSEIDDVNLVQQEIASKLVELTPDSEGAVKISSLEAVAKMVYVAIITGHEHKEVPQPYTLRWVRNTMLGPKADLLLSTFAEVLTQYMPEQTEEEEGAKKKKNAK